ncbi:MAG: histone deacetylase [Hyphomicrobium sp.]|nr:histone deacetylase [Hyphomicrobium sp.]
MAFWSEGRSFDEAVRRTDNTLNVLVVVLLIAFAMCASAYYYGQMNPRVAPQTTSGPAAAAQHSATQPNP